MVYFNREEVQKLDDLAVKNGLEVRQMMELAGWHILEVFRRTRVPEKSNIVIVCGKGNKAGDGLSAARHLADHGHVVKAVLLSRELSPDAGHHMELLEKMHVPIWNYPEEAGRIDELLLEADVIIDALIGYNLRGAPRGDFKDAIEAITRAEKTTISYDLPSGLDSTTGECPGACVMASTTLTLAVPKKCFATENGRRVSGRIFLADIGIPEFLYDQVQQGSRPDFRSGQSGVAEI